MKLQEIEKRETKYEETCDCGKIHVVFTQRDDSPGYYTYVYILCECGECVKFELPAN